jgi:hypothetical protein
MTARWLPDESVAELDQAEKITKGRARIEADILFS